MTAPRPIRRLFIANRGEVAIRVARGAAAVGIASVAAAAQDERQAVHTGAADAVAPLPGSGPSAYLDAAALIAAAQAAGCDAVHPGWGFLSESAAFARACGEAGLLWVGPRPEALEALGDKGAARALAARAGLPLAQGTEAGAGLAAAEALLDRTGAVMVKAAAGGGGRGMRIARSREALAAAFDLCAREAKGAFGDDRLYAEELLEGARHIEVQLVCDRHGGVATLGDRDCSVQRSRQKLVEIAPAPALLDVTRAGLAAAAAALAEACGYDSLGTVEFLVRPDGRFVFMEANARLQVEHTVTEEVTGVDLVAAQLRLAAGETLRDLGLQDGAAITGAAVQARLNAERPQADGAALPAGGRFTAYAPPGGPGVRVDGCGAPGLKPSAAYDSLLAKVIGRGADHAGAARRTERALGEFGLAGADTNRALLRAILRRPEVAAGQVDTAWLDRELAGLLAEAQGLEPAAAEAPAAPPSEAAAPAVPEGALIAPAPLTGALVGFEAKVGDLVARGAVLAVLEAVKMQHEVTAPAAGRVLSVRGTVGETIDEGFPLVILEPEAEAEDATDAVAEEDLDAVRPDLQALIDRTAFTLDANRPDAVARRRKTGQRTARENLDDLLDPGSFLEYGAFAVAAQRRRRSLDDLIANTPADGLIAGVGTVNAAQFGPEAARCAALAYDYTVLAGTQGSLNHKKSDRLLHVAEQERLPVVWYCEGGGGRPGDVDSTSISGLDVTTFAVFAGLSGIAPRLAIASGRCFAGNAVLFGSADVTIATEDSNIGLGGPAMIEGGGLGKFRPEDIGPIDVQDRNGVVDVRCADEAAATTAARRLLGYTQGVVADWRCEDVRRLRRLIPENRLRAYDVRTVIDALFDCGSVLELRRAYGVGIITAFARIEGRPVGVIANDPRHLGGAIDSPGAEKGARFLKLCEGWGLPVVSLCDTPGFMVGPASEETAAVRRGSRMIIAGATLSVPLFCVVLRKGYGLGAQAMAGGGFTRPVFTVAWPTGEFGGMGLEGAVRLGYRKELEAETDPAARAALEARLIERSYRNGRGINIASQLEIDAVIDPAETRAWLSRGLVQASGRSRERRLAIDVW